MGIYVNFNHKEKAEERMSVDSPEILAWQPEDGGLSRGLKDFLRENGFSSLDLNQINEQGETPLTQALKTSNDFAVNELIRHSVDLNKPNQGSEWPLKLAWQLESSVTMALIDAGARDDKGYQYPPDSMERQAEEYFKKHSRTAQEEVAGTENKELDELFALFCTKLKTNSFLKEIEEIYQSILKENKCYFEKTLLNNNAASKQYFSILVSYLEKGRWERKVYAELLSWNLKTILNHRNYLPLLNNLLALSKKSNIHAHQVLIDHIKQLSKTKKKAEEIEEKEVKEQVEIEWRESKEQAETFELDERERKKEFERKGEEEIKETQEQAVAFPKFGIDLFVLTQNDAHISGSRFEGSTSEKTNSFYDDFLNYLICDKPALALIKPHNISILPKLKNIYASVHKMGEFISGLEKATKEGNATIKNKLSKEGYWGASRSTPEALQKICDSFTKEQSSNIVKQLEKDSGSVLLPCGWLRSKNQPGHAMLLNIEKISNGKYKITIFNTGDGLEYHASKVVGSKVKYSPVRVFENIEEQMLQRIVSGLVIEPQLKPQWAGCYPRGESFGDPFDAEHYSKEYLYSKIKELEGYEQQVDERSLAYKTPQWSGSCASSVYKVYFKQALGYDYPSFKALFQYLTNKNYLNSIIQKDAEVGESMQSREIEPSSLKGGVSEIIVETGVRLTEILRQVNLSLENFSRMLVKREVDERIPEALLERCYHELLAMLESLAKFKLKFKKDAKQKIELLAMREDPVIDEGGIKFSRDIEALLSKTNIEVSEDFSSIDFKNTGELLEDLNYFSLQIEQLYRQGRFTEVKKLIESRIFDCIPIQKFQLKDKSEALKLQLYLGSLHKMYLASCKYIDHHGTSEQSATISTIISIMSAKALYEENRDLFECSEVVSWRLKDNLSDFDKYIRSPLFLSYDPNVQEKLSQFKKSLIEIHSIFSVPFESQKMLIYVGRNYPKLIKILYDYAVIKKIPAGRNYNRMVYDLLISEIIHDSEKDFLKKLPEMSLKEKEELFSEIESFKKDFNQQKLAEENQELNHEVLRNNFSKIDLDIPYKINLVKTEEIGHHHKRFDGKLFSEAEKFYRWRKAEPPDSNEYEHVYEFQMSHRYIGLGSRDNMNFVSEALVSKPTTENEVQTNGKNTPKDIETRKLQHLRVEKRNQVFSTIEYYRKNISKLVVENLDEADQGLMNQLILHCNIFEPGVLTKELTENPLLKDVFLKFIAESINLFKKDGIPSLEVAFLYEQAVFLQNFIPEFDLLLDNITNEISQFNKLREEGITLTDKQKIVYARLLKVEALHLLKKITKEPSLTKNQEIIERLYIGRATIKAIEQELPILNKFSKQLDNLCNAEFSANRNQILSADFDVDKVIKEIIGRNYPLLLDGMQTKDIRINGRHPVYTIEPKNIQVNLEEGLAYSASCMIQGLIPLHIRKSKLFIKEFGSANPIAFISLDGRIFRFKYNNQEFIIYAESSDKIELYKKERFNGKGHWLLVKDHKYDNIGYSKEGECFYFPKEKFLSPQIVQNRKRHLIENGSITSFCLRRWDHSWRDKRWEDTELTLDGIEKTTLDNYIEYLENRQNAFRSERAETLQKIEILTEYLPLNERELQVETERLKKNFSEFLLRFGKIEAIPPVFRIKFERRENILKILQTYDKKKNEETMNSLQKQVEFLSAEIDSLGEALRSITLEKALEIKSINEEYQLRMRRRNGLLLEKYLTNFEGYGWSIDIYDNFSDGAPLQVYLHNHKLAFVSKEYKGEWHLFLKDKPSCRLILDHALPNLIKGYSSFLYLEDTTTDPPEQFAILPKKEFSKYDKSKESIYKIPVLSLPESLEDPTYYTVPVINGRLAPQNGEQLAYLTYLNMFQMDEREAFHLLTESLKSTSLSGTPAERYWLTQIYSDCPIGLGKDIPPKQSEIKKWKEHDSHAKSMGDSRKIKYEKILEMYDSYKDKNQIFRSPGFLSVQLLAFYHNFKNHIEINPELFENYCSSEETNKNIIELYYHYLQGRSNTPEALQLPLEVEYAIANYIMNYVKNDSLQTPNNIKKRWPYLNNRHILLSDPPVAESKELKEQMERFTVGSEVSITIDFSSPIKSVDSSQVKVEKPDALLGNLNTILQDPDLFLTHLDYLALIASLKTPIESFYPQQMAVRLQENRDQLLNKVSQIYARNLGKKLTNKNKLIFEFAKLLMIIASNPEKYESWVSEIEGKPLKVTIDLVNQFKSKLGFSSRNLEMIFPAYPALTALAFRKREVGPTLSAVDQEALSKQSLVEHYGLPLKQHLPPIESRSKTDLEVGRLRNEQENLNKDFYITKLEGYLKTQGETFALSLQKDIVSNKDLLKVLEDELLKLVNKKFKERAEHLKLLGKESSLLQMTDLINLFVNGDMNEYERVTGLDPKNAKELHEAISQWLVLSTHTQQMERIKQGLKSLEKYEKGSRAYLDNLHKLGNTIYATRQYTINDHPKILAFEYFENILLRKEQVTTLEGILSKQDGRFKDKVFQLIMGGGKSKVLLPLSAKLRADGQRLCIIKLPKSLFNTNLADLGKTSNRLFGQKPLPFTFERNRLYTAQYFKKLHDRFMSCVLEKNYMVTTNNDMRALQLKYFDLLENLTLHPDDKDCWGQIKWLEKILAIQMDCLDDEVDTSCNILQDLNYPTGKDIALDVNQNTAILELYQLLPLANEDLKTIKEALGYFSNKSEDFSQTKLHELVDASILHPPPLFSTILKKMSEQEIKNLRKYLKNDSSADSRFLGKLSGEQCQYLGIWKHQINHLLKSTLTKRANEKYGFTHDKAATPSDKWYIPIPYSASQNPKEGSEFANIYTATNYTVQMQYLFGIPEDFTVPFIEEFQAKARSECNFYQGMITEETEAQKEFHHLTGLSISLRDFDTKNPKQTQEIYEKIRHRPGVINYILMKKILPNVKMAHKLLNMNAVQEASMYHSLQGVSGTTWNWRSYHERLTLDEEVSKGIDGQTVDYISTKPSAVLTTDQATPQKIIDDYYEQCKEKHEIRAIIDIGALFNDYSNEEVANAIIKKQLTLDKPCKYVLYYNSNDKLCAKLVAEPPSDPIILESTDKTYLQKILACTPDQWFTYFDQARSTGTDIAQAPNGRALATINKDTLRRDLVQGVMRMRDFYYGQNVDYLLPKSVAESMAKPLNIASVLDLCDKNQNKCMEQHHYLSTLRKLQNVYYQNLLNKLKKIKNKKKKLAAYQAFSALFVQELEIDPIKQFLKVEISKDMSKILMEYDQNLQKIWKQAVSAIEGSFQDRELNHLGEHSEKIIHEMLPHLPAKVVQSQVDQAASSQGEAQRQTTQEKVVDQKVAQEQQQQSQIDQYQTGVSADISPYVSAAASAVWTEEDLKKFKEGTFEGTQFKPVAFADCMEAENKLNAELLVSNNYRKTFETESVNTLHGRSKKPLQYIIMRKLGDKVQAMVITQVEAADLQVLLNKREPQTTEPLVWIETSSATLYAGKRPEVLPEQYKSLVEQVNYFSGSLRPLEKTFETNCWFTRQKAQYLCQFFKEHIMSDELVKPSQFASFEERVLVKAELPSSRDEKERDEAERKEQSERGPIAPLLLQYGAETIEEMPSVEILSSKLQKLRQLAAGSKDICTVKIQALLEEIEDLKNKEGFTLETPMPAGQTLKKELEGLKRYPVYHNLMAIFKPKPAPTTL